MTNPIGIEERVRQLADRLDVRVARTKEVLETAQAQVAAAVDVHRRNRALLVALQLWQKQGLSEPDHGQLPSGGPPQSPASSGRWPPDTADPNRNHEW